MPDAVVAHLGVTLKGACGETTATIREDAPAKVQGLLDTANSFNSEFQCAGAAH